MGNWQLEVFKFALYVSFPVGLFYVFNQPKYFEDWVVKVRQELYPPSQEEHRRKFKEALQSYRRQETEKELLQKLEDLK